MTLTFCGATIGGEGAANRMLSRRRVGAGSMRGNRDKILAGGQSLDDKMAFILTQRDTRLLMLCLQLVDRNYTKGGALRFDIKRLRDKLSRQSEEGGWQGKCGD
jgi:hypothetical protein